MNINIKNNANFRFRIMVLNLLNLYSLIIALFDKITGMTEELQNIKRELMPDEGFPSMLYPNFKEKYEECHNEIVKCAKTTSSLTEMTMFALMTTTALTNTTIPYDNISMSSFQYSTENPTTDFFTSSNDWSYSTSNTPTNIFPNDTDMISTSTEYQNVNDTFSDVTIIENIFTETPMTTPVYADDYEGDYTIDTDFGNSYSSTSVFYDKKNNSDETNPKNEIYDQVVSRSRRHEKNDVEQENLCYKKVCCDCKLENLIIDKTQVPKKKKLGILDSKTKTKLKSLCWETMFGQELVKLTVMDLVIDQDIIKVTKTININTCIFVFCSA